MRVYQQSNYITLPGSPYWEKVNYNNYDCQPDYSFNLEKKIETKKLIKELLQKKINYSKFSQKTYLEYLVFKKRCKL